MPDSPLLSYYRGTGTDHAGRQLADVLAWDDDALEQIHDYIQWLFPNTDPSRANSAAPLLTAADAAAFHDNPLLQASLLAAFERILRFYGFRRAVAPASAGADGTGSDGAVTIEAADNWPVRSRNWLQPYNHNHLRLTRIMKCLDALGRPGDARALQRALLDTAAAHPRAVSKSTLRYWTHALD